jgi:hypothetical protein
MIVREYYDALCKMVREHPDSDRFKVRGRMIAIRVREDDEENEKERAAKRETNLSQGIVDVDDKAFELFLM